MNYHEFVDMSFGIWTQAMKREHEPITVTVLGPPGVGKTAAGRNLADRMTQWVQGRNPGAAPAVSWALDLSSMLPEDLMGLPFRDGSVTRYCPQSWMAPLCEDGAYGVLILDDLPAAGGQVQVACRQVSLERRIHEMKLAPGIMVVVTGNRREDKSAATTLPAHFRNSTLMVQFSPDFSGWESWYHSQGYPGDIPAFLHFKRNHFSHLPKDADKLGAFATPRTWAKLGENLPAVHDDHVQEVAAGLVGGGVALEFTAFLLLRKQLVSPEKILEDPRKALPDLGILNNAPDKVIALVTGITEVAVSKAKGAKSPLARGDVLRRFLKAIAWVTSNNREYVSVATATYSAIGGDLGALLSATRKGGSDPDIRALIQYLAKALEK
jgi:hypothetical protein